MQALEVDSSSGRQQELKLLLQAINVVRHGQSSTFLILGDSGIGKSALLSSVASRIQRGNFTRCFDFRALAWTTLPAVYQQMMTLLVRECEEILDRAAETASHHGRELGLSWGRHELLQMLVKARQLAGDPATGLEIQDIEGFRAELIKQVRASLPLKSKIGFQSPPGVDNVAESLIHPWILIAMSFLAPEQSEFRQALDLSERVLKFTQPENASAYISGMKVVLTRINRSLKGWDAGAILLFDGWERMSDPELKDFFADMLFHMNASKQGGHVMAIAACETTGLSYSIGGPLFEGFQYKLLLGPLDEFQIEQWVEANMSDHGLRLPPDITSPLFKLSRGNPYWVRKILAFLHGRLSAGQRPSGSADEWLESLGLLRAEDVLALQFTQLKLMFLGQEENLLNVAGGLLSRFGGESFEMNALVRQLAQGLALEEPEVRDILQALVTAQFITDRNGAYQLDGKPVLDYLSEQTRAIMFTDYAREQVSYLKKVLPLSIQTGELTREKTREVLALCNTFDDKTLLNDMQDLLQTGFLAALVDEQLPVRVAALNGLSFFETEDAQFAIINTLKDSDPVVREYAVRNLGQVLLAKKTIGNAEFQHQAQLALVNQSEDPSDTVRGQVNLALFEKPHWDDDTIDLLMPVVIRALSDSLPTVRLLALQQLTNLETVTAASILMSPRNQEALRSGLALAIRDDNPAIRREACIVLRGLATLAHLDLVAQIPEMLIQCALMDPETDVRVAAVDALSAFSADPVVWRALIGILDNSTHAELEAIEPIQMAVLRILGKQKSATSERALCDFIDATLLRRRRIVEGRSSDGLLWLAIRGLGRIGRSTESLHILENAQADLDNPLILPMLDSALSSVARRLYLQNQALQTKRNAESYEEASDAAADAASPLAYTVHTVYPVSSSTPDPEPQEAL